MAKKTTLLKIVYKDSKGRIVPLSKAKQAVIYRQGRIVSKISFAKVKDSVSNKTKQISKSRVAVERKKGSKAPKKKVQRKVKPVARPTKKKPRSSPLPKKKVSSKKKPSPPPPTRKSPPPPAPPARRQRPKVASGGSKPKAKKPEVVESRVVSGKTKKPTEKKKVIPAPKVPKRFTLEELLEIEHLDHTKRKIRRGKFHGVVGPVTITPYVPETNGYKKVQIIKKVRPINQNRLLSLTILDFELKDPIIVTRATVKQAIRFIKKNFYPHIIRFFARFGAKPYLLRLVVQREDLRYGTISHGIGERRMEAQSFKSLEEFWEQRLFNETTFMKFSKLNYFAQSVDGMIMLKGFTLEVVTKEEEYFG